MRHNYKYTQTDEKRLISQTLKSIVRINAHIHTAKFSSYYPYNQIEEVIGKLKIDNSFNYNKNYNSVAILKTKTQFFKVYFSPVIRERPYTYIEIYGKTLLHNTIVDLYNNIPDLKASQFEYTFDLFCEDHKVVARLFYLLRRHLYFPYAKSTSMSGGRYSGLDLNRSTNAVYEINYGSGSWAGKVYERGSDKYRQKTPKKGGTNWRHKDCDRVRIEITNKRIKLRKKKPATIEELLINPRFLQLLAPSDNSRSRYILFKKFERHPSLPRFYQEYAATDSKGNSGSFQEEYFDARKKLDGNHTRYIEENSVFDSFRKDIIEVVTAFEKKWIRKTKKSTDLFKVIDRDI